MFDIMVHAITNAMRTPAKLVYFEGNVCAGKNTLIFEVKRLLENGGKRVWVFTEDIERWAHYGLLQALHTEGKTGKRSFDALGPLRDYVDRQRFVNEFGHQYDYILFERHPRTTLFVFDSQDDEATYGMFQSTHAAFPFMGDPAITVYIKVPAQICYQRVCERARRDEDSVSVEMIQKLAIKHASEMRTRTSLRLRLIEIDGENYNTQKNAISVCESI
jgi:thymidylate kinase